MAAPRPSEIIALAKEIHGHYRAAFKAIEHASLKQIKQANKRGRFIIQGKCRHDHGWSKCHKKAYFLRRACRTLVEKRRALRRPF